MNKILLKKVLLVIKLIRKLDNLFYEIRTSIYYLIQTKNISIDKLSIKLGIDSSTFIKNFKDRIDDFTFYLKTLELLESWDIHDTN